LDAVVLALVYSSLAAIAAVVLGKLVASVRASLPRPTTKLATRSLAMLQVGLTVACVAVLAHATSKIRAEGPFKTTPRPYTYRLASGFVFFTLSPGLADAVRDAAR
tara:strand:+ start:76 stop:393 length:318 start_codon:yes stop_codon:yes gene_type:complete